MKAKDPKQKNLVVEDWMKEDRVEFLKDWLYSMEGLLNVHKLLWDSMIERYQ